METIKSGCLVKIKPDLSKTEKCYTVTKQMSDMVGETHIVYHTTSNQRVSVYNVNTKTFWHFHRDDIIILDNDKSEDNKIYVITTVGYGNRNRCVGFYYDERRAIEEVENNSLDINEAGYYHFCVIEEQSQGIYPIPTKQIWFKWNPEIEGYSEISEAPEKFRKSVCFGIG
jgi:hypothetical protein